MEVGPYPFILLVLTASNQNGKGAACGNLPTLLNRFLQELFDSSDSGLECLDVCAQVLTVRSGVLIGTGVRKPVVASVSVRVIHKINPIHGRREEVTRGVL